MDRPAVHLFNPENDLALAAGVEYYTAPAAGVAMRHAGDLLPLFWAADGDTVLVDKSRVDETRKFARQFRPAIEVSCTCASDGLADPWGWSPDTRRRFINAGIDEDKLPDRATIALWREFSHRRLTVDIRRMTGADDAYECFSFEEVSQAVSGLDGRAVIKLPWSSSGRGVFYVENLQPEVYLKRIDGMLHRQGSVMVEPYRDRRSDFAALFYIDRGCVEFRSLSFFSTMDNGAYSGNVIAGNDEIVSMIGIDPSAVVAGVSDALERTIGAHYRGWVGVDMLTYEASDGKLTIEPCVEVNLRRTMGVVAHELYRRGHHGLMKVYSGGLPDGFRPLLPPAELGIAYMEL